MFQRNEITNIVQLIYDIDQAEKLMKEQLNKFNKIHSAVVYNKFVDGEFSHWELHYNIGQLSKFNDLKTTDSIRYLVSEMRKQDNRQGYVNCFVQSSAETIIKSRKPLILKLAKEQHDAWEHLEMEDLIQMCNLVICDLYYRGYYIHKNLIRRAFINYVLMHIRKDKGKPNIVSLEQDYGKSDNDERISIKDMIPDVKLLNEQSDKEDKEVENQILTEMRDVVISIIGPRQYDQMLREYGNKQTTNWSRKLMQTIKAKLFELGINAKSFNKYYK